MNNHQLVVLFGESLLLDSVEASLAIDPAVSVMRLHSTAPEVAQRLSDLSPDLVIFDLDTSDIRGLAPFLKTQPSVPMLGLDINCNKVVGLTTEVHDVLNVDELKRVLERYTEIVVNSHRPESSPLRIAVRGAGA